MYPVFSVHAASVCTLPQPPPPCYNRISIITWRCRHSKIATLYSFKWRCEQLVRFLRVHLRIQQLISCSKWVILLGNCGCVVVSSFLDVSWHLCLTLFLTHKFFGSLRYVNEEGNGSELLCFVYIPLFVLYVCAVVLKTGNSWWGIVISVNVCVLFVRSALANWEVTLCMYR
jgi:hypothetical protein